MRQFAIPQFTLGMPAQQLRETVDRWNADPSAYLSYEKRSLPKAQINGPWLEFPSFIDSRDTARFYCAFEPKWRSGSTIGSIVIPHWNATSKKYISGTAWIRRFFIPTNTLVYVPEYHDGRLYAGGPQYHVLGPNIYNTIRRVQQDVLNIQFAAAWLRDAGCTEIGLWAYSIGSLRACLAALFAPNFFDFFIWHFACDNFAEAVMDGIATADIASAIKDNISRDDLEYYWSIISPGHYSDYLHLLPKATRVVQGRYDPVLSPPNVQRMTEKFRKYAPHVEVYTGEFGHATLGSFANAARVLSGNIRFYYTHTGLRFI